MGRLTPATARAASKPGLYGDANTLYLRVGKGGSKSWVQRVTIRRRRRDMGLGSFPTISLAEARARATANRLAIFEGRDPLEENRRARRSLRRDTTTGLNIADCIIETCPWSGKPIQEDSLTEYGGLVVGFCDTDCRDKFDAALRHFEQAAAKAAR